MAPLRRCRKTQFLTVYPTIYPPNEHFEYLYPHSNAFLGLFTVKCFPSKIEALQAAKNCMLSNEM